MAIYVLIDIVLIVACQPGSFFMELLAGYVYGIYIGVSLICAAKLTAAGESSQDPPRPLHTQQPSVTPTHTNAQASAFSSESSCLQIGSTQC